MAAGVKVSIYAINGQAVGTNQGLSMVFPTNLIMVRPLIPADTFNTQTCVTQIQLLPTGLTVHQPVYYTSTSVDNIATAIG